MRPKSRQPADLPKPRHVTRRGEPPNPIDVHVGFRLRLARIQAGASQEALAAAVEITFQQLQKYERGTNRISASRLFDLARALGLGVEYFFEGLSPDAAADADRGEDLGVLRQYRQRETLELVRAFHRIQAPQIRRQIFELIEAMSKKDESPD